MSRITEVARGIRLNHTKQFYSSGLSQDQRREIIGTADGRVRVGYDRLLQKKKDGRRGDPKRNNTLDILRQIGTTLKSSQEREGTCTVSCTVDGMALSVRASDVIQVSRMGGFSTSLQGKSEYTVDNVRAEREGTHYFMGYYYQDANDRESRKRGGVFQQSYDIPDRDNTRPFGDPNHYRVVGRIDNFGDRDVFFVNDQLQTPRIAEALRYLSSIAEFGAFDPKTYRTPPAWEEFKANLEAVSSGGVVGSATIRM